MDNNIPGTCIVSVEEEITQSTFNLYPNPANDVLNISFQNTIINEKQIRIFEGIGKICYQKNISSNSLRIDISDYTEGIYLFEVIENGNRTTKKIIKLK